MTEPVEKCSHARHEKGCQTRHRIIEAATAILAEEGAVGLTTRTVCEKAGIGKGSLYHHFENTHELIIEVYRHFMEHYFGAMIEQEFTSVDDFFLKFGEQAIAQISASYKLRERSLSLLPELLADERFVSDALGKSTAMQQALVGKLSTLAGGEVPNAVLRDSVLALITLLEGTESLLIFTHDEERFRAMWKMAAKLLADNVKLHTKRSAS